ncbi:hypothetical protein CVD25_00425 [Bacillus canaveralius]|uniref:Glycosyl transferase family 1 domain-containing protein n=1 Tax=Bacillus canaveralius TaxID=1403243 RepID=A0A2N5GQA1_9BACI|nr:glycosyltransferase [Bacillus canaveralius]PLR85056.1 hypothetical protein CU635_04560 [Bacillus canaveralius]PLS00946.1 hypothetical protein CVD25_00425 [Bacillus canaveralius]RSK54188.1 glycosyltransferase [Bacillus canaveralius]
MKVIFLSNYLTHHQIPFSEEMYNMPNVDYYFVATSIMPDDRVTLGYTVYKSEDYPFLISYNNKNYEYIEKLIDDSDLVIIGSAPYKLIKKRLKNNKLTFAYSERLFKNFKSFLSIMLKGNFLKLYYLPSKKSMTYMLCSSAFTASDLSKICSYKNKVYKWGYFTEHISYNTEELMQKKKKDRIKILWAGRMLKWKHPEMAVKTAVRLKKDGYNFNLDIIGTGEEEYLIKKLIKQYNLDDCITLLGAMSPKEVREHMENSNIFLVTSDFNEGWGAVLNESMNSGCAVIASHGIGSVPFLVKDGENGLIFRNRDINSLYKKVKYLFDNPTKIEELGNSAYKTINDQWNAKVAAERLIILAQQLLVNKDYYGIKDGPCSKAYILDNNWYR